MQNYSFLQEIKEFWQLHSTSRTDIPLQDLKWDTPPAAGELFAVKPVRWSMVFQSIPLRFTHAAVKLGTLAKKKSEQCKLFPQQPQQPKLIFRSPSLQLEKQPQSEVLEEKAPKVTLFR